MWVGPEWRISNEEEWGLPKTLIDKDAAYFRLMELICKYINFKMYANAKPPKYQFLIENID